jgi:hypothetical protein
MMMTTMMMMMMEEEEQEEKEKNKTGTLTNWVKRQNSSLFLGLIMQNLCKSTRYSIY